MDNATLQAAIDLLAKTPKYNEPFVGFHENDSHGFGYTIKANKEGLVKLAATLLEAAQHDYEHATIQNIPLEIDKQIQTAEDGLLPEAIELAEKAETFAIPATPKPHWAKAFFSKAGCLVALAFIVVSLVAGVIVVLKWIF